METRPTLCLCSNQFPAQPTGRKVRVWVCPREPSQEVLLRVGLPLNGLRQPGVSPVVRPSAARLLP